MDKNKASIFRKERARYMTVVNSKYRRAKKKLTFLSKKKASDLQMQDQDMECLGWRNCERINTSSKRKTRQQSVERVKMVYTLHWNLG